MANPDTLAAFALLMPLGALWMVFVIVGAVWFGISEADKAGWL